MPEANAIGAPGNELLQLLQHLQESPLSSSDQEEWHITSCRIKDLAQDQRLVEFDRGLGRETWYAHRKDTTNDDAQSDFRYTPRSSAVISSYVLNKVRAQLRPWSVDDVEADQDESASPCSPHEAEPSVDKAEWTSDDLTKALDELDMRSNWAELRELISVAEDISFTPEQSARAAPRLLEIAVRYRDSNDPQDEAIIWSAIRTGASMLRPDEAYRLLPLLEPGHAIETSLVAIKMLGRVFEAQPPADIDRYPDLAGKISEIINSLLNAYVIATAQGAAMAQLGVYALAATASSNIVWTVQSIRQINITWFTRRTNRSLRELQEHWQSRPVTVATGPRNLLEQAIEALQG